MATKRALAIILTVAALHAAFYIWYQRPDWHVAWTDQGGYHLLARGLAASGRFTRYPSVTPFVPEAIRTPGYPLFVAAVITIAGDHQTAVAAAQAALFLIICWMVFLIGRRAGSTRAALAAAAVTACFAPLPYFGALMMTELFTTFVLMAAVLAAFNALERSSTGWAIAAGAGFAYTALSRPVYILLPPFLLVASLPLVWSRAGVARQARLWAALIATFVIVVLPWFTYNYRHFGMVTISAAGGIGRPIWEGSWQGHWAGRVQADLTRMADTPMSDAELEVSVRRFAERQHDDAGPMLTYVSQWRGIRKIWTEPTDPQERFEARIVGDRRYLQVGLDNIRANPAAFLRRRVLRGQFVLWAAEIPVRFTDIDRLPTWVIRAIWIPQVVLVVLGATGLVGLARRRQRVALLLLGAPLLYVTAVHFLLLTEARQSLPVKPLLILAAVAGLSQSAAARDVFGTRPSIG